ncbi:6-hydroxymethylpterin diphosphokinase MptE-like protein [Colwellia psychrerythraea]|uniref:DUF115 domain-containing protein n=1 Tax=Colwellia psychrerythraea TaxID=28229 RepID=A0A099L2B7_COLPS|nr:6-hydroxymethylpterin diphosphokinase MptE-like protein [Colwellia psychrerythraea]KGJ97001.1 protein of unknown function DUF115 [Colwellia psychrerythraea]
MLDTSSFALEKMILLATLQANLDSLKVYVPEIYQQFKSYTPENTWVVIDDDGNPNLFNNNKCVYENNAREFCRAQVEQYMAMPDVYVLDIPVEQRLLNRYDHTRVLSKISEKRKTENPIRSRHYMDEERLDLLLILGMGLGYQVEELIQQKKIQNLLLCEPSCDVFYAMLHCLELKPIIESCKALGGTVTFTIGGNALDPVNAISQFFQNYGHGHIGRFYIFKHYDSVTNDETIKQLKQLGYRLLFGWGFMEDEINGLKHTLANIQSGYKVCKTKNEFTNKTPQRPVFIAANGPSLDYCMGFLRENQNELIIISCGTTLKALLKNNITPDIHVEMERQISLVKYIEGIEQQQEKSLVKLKDIQLVALNTVHPEVLEKFKSPLLLTKNADVGGVFIESIDKLGLYAITKYPNPTCVNSAMELVTLLGFKEIYLLGTDFGYASKEHHHSKDSVYYDKEYELKDTIDAKMTDDLSRKGNFREFVHTNAVYDSTRINLEFLLSKNRDVNVYNTADGAYITLTEPRKIENIKFSSKQENKQEFLKRLLDDAFDNQQLELSNVVQTLKESSHVLKVTLEQFVLKMDKQVSSREELADIFADQYSLLKELSKREEYKFNYWLIQGTFRYYQSMIMSHSYLYGDLNTRNDFMNYCLHEFKEHLTYLYNEFLTTYNKV